MNQQTDESDTPSAMNRRELLQKLIQGSAWLALGQHQLGQALAQGIHHIAVQEREFDFVVIGSGAGGGPLACNLVKAGFSVCLLEAGGDEPGPHYSVPVFHGLSTEVPQMSWEFYVKHYAHRPERDSKYVSKSRTGQSGIFYPRAATLGGCTAHNAMITLYPNQEDWNDIARLVQDTSWQAERMRTYFQQVELNAYAAKPTHNPERRGYQGWLQTEQTNPLLGLKDKTVRAVLISALKQEGVADELLEKLLQKDTLLLDPNSWSYVQNKIEGLFNIPKATRQGKRNGTREYIYQTLRNFPDRFEVRKQCLATQLLFDTSNPDKVIGVEYMKGPYLYRASPLATSTASATKSDPVKEYVKAKREVLLCAGAFNSPQLLQLSGIGDHERLRGMGIRPRGRNLTGVGKNLQDRYEISVISELHQPIDLINSCHFSATEKDPCFKEYQAVLKTTGGDQSKSLYASNGVLISLLKKSNPQEQSPDLCLFAVPGHFKGYYPGWSEEALTKNILTWAILKGHTRNRGGEVKIVSTDPRDTPDINFRYFEEGTDREYRDLQDVRTGLKYIRALNQRSPLKPMIKKELWPGPAVNTDSELSEFIINESWGHHASCTNAMGPASDPNSVVDHKFRVHGIKNLRVVDASIFPRIPGLFIVVPIYMVSHKASEDIIQEYRGAW